MSNFKEMEVLQGATSLRSEGSAMRFLIRAPDSNSAKEHFNEGIKRDLFGVLREKFGTNLHRFIEEKVFPVLGDTTCDGLEINSELKDEMHRERHNCKLCCNN